MGRGSSKAKQYNIPLFYIFLPQKVGLFLPQLRPPPPSVVRCSVSFGTHESGKTVTKVWVHNDSWGGKCARSYPHHSRLPPVVIHGGFCLRIVNSDVSMKEY